MYFFIPIIIVLIYLFLIFPNPVPKNRRKAFIHGLFAHRGLYLKDQSVPENSTKAFKLAVENGYGIELDVQLSSDNHVVVFHDDDFMRSSGKNIQVHDLTFKQIQNEIRLFGTEYTLPEFSEVLQIVNGQVPLIIELKSSKYWKLLCIKTLDALKDYQGEYCIESFDPFIVRWFKINAKNIVRGQLAKRARYSSSKKKNIVSFAASRLLFNFLSRPHFIAYEVGQKPLSVKFAERLGAFRVAWTVHEKDINSKFLAENDDVIFEHFYPNHNLFDIDLNT